VEVRIKNSSSSSLSPMVIATAPLPPSSSSSSSPSSSSMYFYERHECNSESVLLRKTRMPSEGMSAAKMESLFKEFFLLLKCV
jgi:hypothetical protein